MGHGSIGSNTPRAQGVAIFVWVVRAIDSIFAVAAATIEDETKADVFWAEPAERYVRPASPPADLEKHA